MLQGEYDTVKILNKPRKYIKIKSYVYGLRIDRDSYDKVEELEDIYITYEIEGYPEEEYEYSIFTNVKKENYLCVKKRYSVEELKEIEDYCTCVNCNSYFIKWNNYVKRNIITKMLCSVPCGIMCFIYMMCGLLRCSCCVGCIKAGPSYAYKMYIDKAYELYNNESVRQSNKQK